MEGISRGRLIGRHGAVGFGYISIPIDVPRDTFVDMCYIKERVNIMLVDSPTIIKNCAISRDTLNDINFPEKYDERGSLVLFVTHETTGKPTIIARISKRYETQLLEEHGWKKQFIQGDNMSAILMRGKNGEICLTVDSDKATGGIVTINVKHKKNKGLLNLNCKGKVNVNASDDVTVKSQKEIILKTVSYSGDGTESTKSSILLGEKFAHIKNQVVLSEDNYHVARAEDLIIQLETLQTNIDIIKETLLNAPPIAPDGGVTFQSFLNTTLRLMADADFKNVASKKVSCD